MRFQRMYHCWCWAILLFLAFSFTGCGGCRDDTTSQDSTNKAGDEKPDEELTADGEKKRKPDFETKPVVLFPGYFKDEAKLNRFKLGHWSLANLRATANNFDSSGQMHAYSVDARGQKVPIAGTSFHADSTRPAVLAKGQAKNLETMAFLPKRNADASAANLHIEIIGSTGLPLIDITQPVLLMKPFQFHWVVLSPNNDQYKYLRFLDCVQIPRLGSENAPPFYVLVFPTPGEPIPLAPSALAWTTIGYILWDQLSPESLSPEQQTALVDWLHFGGQLIVSGPNTVDKLKGSFLDPYLPAAQSQSRNLSGGDFQQINDYWSSPMAKSPERKWELSIPESSPMLGAELKLTPGSHFVDGCEGLVAERQVGRGRIVITSFSLSDKRIQKWPSLPAFFNGALLRKPSREFGKNSYSEFTFRWQDDQASIFDPLLGSTLRFISRDLNTNGTSVGSFLSDERPENDILVNQPAFRPNRNSPEIGAEALFSLDSLSHTRNQLDTRHYGGFEADSKCGTGAWNDETGVASSARSRISLSAGINPPSPNFVLQMLGVYLVVLVPLNWIVFRCIGRVEWAWIAAPVIAIGGAIAVVKMASLDIGFVRSQSQIGLLELYAGLDRGHLTEYSALYTSLSTRYEVQFNDSTGLALPFSRNSATGANVERILRPVYLERTIGNRMRDFLIQSNSTGMLHNENLLDVGGKFELTRVEERATVRNGSGIDIKKAGVVQRLADGQLQHAWIGELAAGQDVELKFETIAAADLYSPWLNHESYISLERRCRKIWDVAAGARPVISLNEVLQIKELQSDIDAFENFFQRHWEGAPNETSKDVDYELFLLAFSRAVRQPGQDQLGLGEIFDVISGVMELGNGEMRLIGETESAVGQHTLVPQSTQSSRSTMVLVHLQLPKLPVAAADRNNLLDFLGKSDLDWLLEGQLEEEQQNESDQTDPESQSNDDAKSTEKIDSGGG